MSLDPVDAAAGHSDEQVAPSQPPSPCDGLLSFPPEILLHIRTYLLLKKFLRSTTDQHE